MRARLRHATSWRDKVWGKGLAPARAPFRTPAPALAVVGSPPVSWTPELVRSAAARVARGETVAAVAASLGVPADQVDGRLRDAGYLRKPRRPSARTAQFAWTEERTALAVRRWGEGVLATLIAAELTAAFGEPVTKSAVIGKLTRLGVTGSNAAPDAPQRRTGRPVGFRKGRDFSVG